MGGSFERAELLRKVLDLVFQNWNKANLLVCLRIQHSVHHTVWQRNQLDNETWEAIKQAERSTYCAYACLRATTVSSSLWSWTHKTSTKTLNAGGGGTWESRTTSKRRLVALPTRKKSKSKEEIKKANDLKEKSITSWCMHACIIHWVLAFDSLHCRMLSSSCLLDFAKKNPQPQLWKNWTYFIGFSF